MDIASKVEEISEFLVLADLDDLQELANLHTLFVDFQTIAENEGVSPLPEAAEKLAKIIEGLILNQSSDAQAELEVVSRSISVIQEIVRDKRAAEDVEFPEELKLDLSPQVLDDYPKPEAAPEPEPGTEPEPTKALTLPTDLTLNRVAIIQVDPELLTDFIHETREHLDSSENLLLALESNPEQQEDAINSIFRAIHTTKGLSSFIGLNHFETLSHRLETLLDHGRQKKISLQGRNIDLALKSVDALREIVNHLTYNAGELTEQAPGNFNDIIARLDQAQREAVAGAPLPRATLRSAPAFITEASELLDEVERCLLDLEKAPKDREAVNTLFRAFHTIKSSAALIGIKDIESFAHCLETFLDQARDHAFAIEGSSLNLVFDAQSVLKLAITALDEAVKNSGFFAMPETESLMARARLLSQGIKPEKADFELTPTPSAEKESHAKIVKEVIRVESERLDLMIDTIGELVISVSMLSQTEELRGGLSSELGRRYGQLNKITRSLQEMAMSLRMVPIRPVFQKIARLIRDLARKSGKEIDFTMSGEDTELDKTVVDRIGDPLVHMARNAVDHGIEDFAADRVQNGKPSKGAIHLRAFHKSGSIFIEIEDDGKGLNRDEIFARAVERDLTLPDTQLTDDEIFSFIFEPGFSTAKEITEISGRGVGMDVVKRDIEALRGGVDIQTSLGKGCVFSVRLPLTLAIIDGMVVRVGHERYIVPTLSIARTVSPKEGDLAYALGRGLMLVDQDETVPVISLRELFGVTDNLDITRRDNLVVVVDDDAGRVGLLVDELLGQEQIVIKPLGEALGAVQGVSGAAIMPDGLVGLILDISGIVKTTRARQGLRISENQ